MANVETQTPVRVDTCFEGGSISKWIAAIVVLHQVDKGTLALDEPIAKYLPAFRHDNGSRLTLAYLMSHSSGVPNQVIPALRADPLLSAQAIMQDEAVLRYASGDLQFAPGTQWDYSHSNWLLVKAVLEHVTATPYETLAAQLLWQPLKLKHSGIFHGESLVVPGMAQSYRQDAAGAKQDDAGKLRPQPSAMPEFFTMAGGFYTTAPEMFRLMQVVVDGNVLSPAMRSELFKVRMPEQHYCLGGRVRTRVLRGQNEDVVWEDGSNKGFRMLAVRVRRTGESVVITNNTGGDQPAMGDLADQILQEICV
jgi:D-alanyl-D-alanine carboxypeptidase